jgi:hypothetical protein
MPQVPSQSKPLKLFKMVSSILTRGNGGVSRRSKTGLESVAQGPLWVREIPTTCGVQQFVGLLLVDPLSGNQRLAPL